MSKINCLKLVCIESGNLAIFFNSVEIDGDSVLNLYLDDDFVGYISNFSFTFIRQNSTTLFYSLKENK